MMVGNQARNTVEVLLKDIYFKIGTYREAKNRFSSKLAPEFSIFNYFRCDEVAVSRIIADLLNPKGTHGQGSIFLQAFFEQMEGVDCGWINPTGNWKVETEKQTNDQRRIDVFLESSLGVVGIENKPWATDQDNQLRDYALFLEYLVKDKTGNWLLVYLGNNDPQESSISKEDREFYKSTDNLVTFDFNKVDEWLRRCSTLSESIAVRVFIEDLAKFVRININGELDMTEEKEVVDELLKSTENLESAFQIANAFSASKEQLLGKFRNDLDSKLKEKPYILEWDDAMTGKWTSCCGFGFSFNELQPLYLRIEFERTGLNEMIWGVRRRDESIIKSVEIWQSIHEEMNSRFANGKQTDWWPWYSEIPDHNFDTSYMNWGSSVSPWIDMMQNDKGSLSEKIVALADKVYELFSDDEKMTFFEPRGLLINSSDMR